MATRRKLSAGELRWAAVAVGVMAFSATVFSDLGASLAFRDGGSIAIAEASIGPVPLKFVLVISAAVVVGLLYLAARRANDPDNSN